MKTQQTCSPLNRKEFYDTVFIVHRVFLKMPQFSAKYLSDFFFFFFFFIHVSLPNELEHTTSKYGGDGCTCIIETNPSCHVLRVFLCGGGGGEE